MNSIPRLTLMVWVALVWGCATPTRKIAPLAPGIYDLKAQQPINTAELANRLQRARYVLVGETHDSQSDHDLQARIYTLMLQNGRVALGMEMFQRPFQPYLDAFSSGEFSEEAMLDATEYAQRWGFDTKFYSPLWNAARDRLSPIVALNIRVELTKRVSAVGLHGLTQWERADLPQINEGPQRYADWLKSVFEGHGMKLSPERFRRFFQAQLLWDETMAETASDFLARHKTDRMMIIVGRGHVERRWGIPTRLERREPTASIITIVSVSKFDTLESLAAESLADFVVVD